MASIEFLGLIRNSLFFLVSFLAEFTVTQILIMAVRPDPLAVVAFAIARMITGHNLASLSIRCLSKHTTSNKNL